MIGILLAAAPQVSGLNLSMMDRSITIQTPEDLPKLAYGTWLRKVQIPADKPMVDNFESVFDRNQTILRGILESAAKRQEAASTPVGRVGLFYRVAMDQGRANRLGMRPISAELREIANIRNARDVARVLGDFQSKGISAGFNCGPNQDDLNPNRLLATFQQGGQILPDRETYWSPGGAPLRKAYGTVGTKLFGLAGLPDPVGQTQAALNLETALAKVSSAPVELRNVAANYHVLTAKQAQKLTPAFDWATFWRASGVRPQTTLNVNQPKFFAGFSKLLQTAPMSQWRSYLRMQLLYGESAYLSDAAANARFILGSTLTGQPKMPDRWKRAQSSVDGAIGDDLSRLYVAKAFSPAAKAKVETLVRNLLLSLGDRIPKLVWMEPATKRKAVEKLKHFRIKVGYPDTWKTYAGLELRDDSWVQNVQRGNAFEWRRQWAKMGKPIDRSEWGMTASTVNAYYNPYNNEIVFPAGILQPTFYNPNADDAANYGAIGMVIGHEITHGFDDQGSQFDAYGKRQNWWTAADAKNFKEAGEAIVKQYGALKDPYGVPVNGQLTLGENMADIGGLAIAYEAYHRSLKGKEAPVIDGWTGDQRFFLAASQAFRGKIRKEFSAMLTSVDPHSPDSLRSYVPESDHPAFYRSFGLEAPKNLPHVW